MESAVRPLDVCVHRPTGRRCLVVAARSDGSVECVDADDRRFVCRPWELVPYTDPAFDAEASGPTAGPPRDDHRRREARHAAALRAAAVGARRPGGG